MRAKENRANILLKLESDLISFYFGQVCCIFTKNVVSFVFFLRTSLWCVSIWTLLEESEKLDLFSFICRLVTPSETPPETARYSALWSLTEAPANPSESIAVPVQSLRTAWLPPCCPLPSFQILKSVHQIYHCFLRKISWAWPEVFTGNLEIKVIILLYILSHSATHAITKVALKLF